MRPQTCNNSQPVLLNQCVVVSGVRLSVGVEFAVGLHFDFVSLLAVGWVEVP